MMRRKKDSKLDGKELVTLPEKTIELRELDFSQEERDICRSLAVMHCGRLWLTLCLYFRRLRRGEESGDLRPSPSQLCSHFPSAH